MTLLWPTGRPRDSDAKSLFINDDAQKNLSSKQEFLSEREKWSWRYLKFIKTAAFVISFLLLMFFLTVTGRQSVSIDSTNYDCFSSLESGESKGHLDSEKNDNLKEERVLSSECAAVSKEFRFDCHPENGASELSCTARRCCWNPVGDTNIEKSTKVPLNVPYCYYPEGWNNYEFVDDISNVSTLWKNISTSTYELDVNYLRMDVIQINNDIARIKFSDRNHTRWEPHLPIRPETPNFEENIDNAQYEIITDAPRRPSFRIRRTSNHREIFTVTDGFIFADQFLQLSALLPSSNIYGLGEHRSRFRLNTNWQIITMFNKDQPPTENANLYGSHPFYLLIEDTGHCHGVLFLNSNAMDIILQPTPAITFRSIGGIFDMYFFMGPSPSDVIRQYSEIVGKPFMPPYWSLGFHLCRYGYGSLEKTREVWNRTRAVGIPFDTQWNDLDYMKDNADFTYDKEKFNSLPKFVEELHKLGMKYIPLIDAGIEYGNGIDYRPLSEGIERAIFIKESNSPEPFKGKCWNRDETVWPDFTNPHTSDYWREMMNDMWNMFRYDGAWIDMNEPSNFYNGLRDGCPNNRWDYPVYVPNVVGNLMATKTLCMNARHYLGSHYDIHNTHGTSEAAMTNKALAEIRGHRPFVISRSTWVGHGHYAGHWGGDIYSSWHDMRMSIPQLLSFSLFQVPMMGADICGFDGNTTEALCNRWMQLGAFYPFSRNHNSDDTIEQDPVAMGELVVKSSRKALMIRYRFLPYLYTLFFRAHKFGDTVARPLFFEFPEDPLTYDIDSQFLWGSSLMILPVFEEGATQVTAYLPKGIWYDFYNKTAIISIGKNYTLEANLDTIPLLVHGGSILPAQTPATTTTTSRENPFELLIAPDHLGNATGELYWDDGDSIDSIDESDFCLLIFTLEKTPGADGYLKSIRLDNGKYTGRMILGKVQVMGIAKEVTRVAVNEKDVPFHYDAKRLYLTVKDLQIDLKDTFVLVWG